MLALTAANLRVEGCRWLSLSALFELSNTDSELNRVHSGVGNRESSVGNVHILERYGGVVSPRSERNMHANAGLRREIHAICAAGDVVIGE